ncbi:DUF7344 domain-containing protein [Halovivax gelatinilyticus]|uniref:DUF7344 domain-containing protein n=1 Tax=Halovivax gelatinilyticus TaxID=2961597 RepID=UPI0020CA812E|nr:hypothetical protein [Halovivax gelatinilyticus]
MTVPTTPTDARRTGTELTMSTAFELLADRHRRLALYCLSNRVEAITRVDLAAEIANRLDGPNDDLVEHIGIRLHHSHLPRLDEVDVVRYDPDVDRVQSGPALTTLEPFLELARAEERSTVA